MNLAIFIASTQIKSLFSNRWKSIKNLLLLLASILNGLLVGYSIHILLQQNKLQETDVTTAIPAFIFVSVHIFGFFSSYIRRTNIVMRLYPRDRFSILFANILHEVVSLGYLCCIVFLLGLELMHSQHFLTDLSVDMVALLAGLMSTRVIKGLIEYRIKGKLLLVFFFITVMGLAVLSYLKFRILLTPYLAVLMGCVTIDMRVESRKYSDVTTKGVSFGNQSLWQYFFKNRKSRITLSFSFILKVVLLAIFLRLPEDMNWLANVFIISPVILYTYLFNNAWGFFPEIWIQTQIRYCSWKQRLWFYIKLISYPILIDALITFVALIIFEKLDLFHAYIYLSSVVMMTVTGFVVSLTNATRVHKLVNFLSGHRNTSITGILLNYLLIGILWLPAIRPGFIYIALTACLIWLLVIIFFWKHLYQKRYRIFTQLKS